MQDNRQKSKWRGRIVRYAPLVLWIGLIMFLSSGQASMSNTSRVIRPLLIFLFPAAPEEILNVYHGYVRKAAHVTVYAILAFWAFRAFFSSSHRIVRGFWYCFAFAVVLLVAAIDETNQSYISSRTGSVYDVLLDAIGGAAMILLIVVFRSFVKNYRPSAFADR
jgi:VanZ family protein